MASTLTRRNVTFAEFDTKTVTFDFGALKPIASIRTSPTTPSMCNA
jgi:hypothetical protein